jgi:hypothetical protein
MNTAGRLYRILNFHHVVQIFERGELHFAHPSSWADPYETRLVHQDSHKIFAQCWCSKGVSDAMWRIYSPNQLGIRISTSTRKLRQALEKEVARQGMMLRIGDVNYMSPFKFDEKAKEIHSELAASFDLRKATDLLFVKREAFNHESEYRAIILAPNADRELVEQGLKIKVDPRKLIDNILIDPRAPDELSNALVFYFKEKIEFTKRVERSVLYKSPTPLVIE